MCSLKEGFHNCFSNEIDNSKRAQFFFAACQVSRLQLRLNSFADISKLF